VAGRVADAVVSGGAWPSRCPAFAVLDAAGGGVNSANAEARSGVASSDSVAASASVAASIAVTTATAVTNAPATTCTDAAAEARDATPSSWPHAASGNAATSSVATRGS